MKHVIKIALLWLLMLGTALTVAAAGFAPEDAYFSTYRTLGEGLSFSEYYVDTDDTPQHGYLFSYEYMAEGSVFPIVTTGEHVWGAETVQSMGKLLTEQGQNVIGGTNGDFFSFATGIPLGALVSDGKVLSTDAGAAAFGIRGDGTYIIGSPNMTVKMTRFGVASSVRDAVGDWREAVPTEEDSARPLVMPAITLREEQDYPIAHIGKYPAVWGAYLNTYDYGKSTHSSEKSTEFVFAICDGDITLGESVTAILTEVRVDATDTPIPEGGFVVSVQNDCAKFSDYADLSVGDAVKVSVETDAAWEGVVTVIGGGDILIRDGEICEDLLKEGHARTAKPRVAIGYTEDGVLKLFALDGKGKASGSVGMNLNSLAETMQAFGCVQALNLDGGGSETVLLRGEDGVLSVGNIPSEETQRKVSNAILFVNTEVSDGVPYFMEITPRTALVYKGSALPLSLAFYDRAYMPCEMPSGMQVSWSAEGGSIDENGVFRADEGVKTARVTATVTGVSTLGFAGEIWKETQTVWVLDTLDALHITEGPLSVPLGGQSRAAFSAVGEYCTYPVALDAAYLSAVFAETGERVCDDGELTEQLTLKSTVTEGYGVLEGFPTYTVRVGLKDQMDIYCEADVTFGAASSTVWSMDDDNPDTLFSSDASAVLSKVDAIGYDGGAALSFSGSYLAPIETPTFAHPPKAFTMWLREATETELYMTVSAGDQHYDIPWVRVFDNERLTGYSEYRADLTSLWADGITDVTIDALLCASTPFFAFVDEVRVDYGDALTVFSDLEGHWAEESVAQLYRMGIVSGSPDGAYYAYDPKGELTRGAFAKLLCLFTALVPEENADLSAMFLDADEISTWAAPYIAAVVDAGLMRGKTAENGDGLRFSANDVMTRAEVFQVLGALIPQKEDIADMEIPTFSDDADIPNWARANVEYCISRGLISGFSDGTLRPLAKITRGEIAALFCRVEKEM